MLLGAGLTVGGILSASAANITQAMEGAKKQPFLALLAWAMTIGVLINTVFALVTAGPPQFDPRPSYTMGILFLGLAGSVVTFPLHYNLVREIGAGRTAYNSILTISVAMLLSTVFEDYRWTWLTASGMGLAVLGMILALRARTPRQPVVRAEGAAVP